jgi:hypothetical protein
MSASDRPDPLDGQPAIKRRSQGPTCVSDLTLDRIALGETNDQERAAVSAHLAACPACTRASEALAAERAAFAHQAAIPNLAADVLARSQRETRRVWKHVLLRRMVLPLAMGLGVFAISLMRTKPETRTKGEFALAPYVLHPESSAAGTLHLGEPLHPGDKLQFRYSGGQAGYLAIISVDATGEVSLYYPPGAAAVPVAAGRDVALETAVELDGTLGREMIVGLRCASALPVETIRAAARKAASEARARGAAPTELGGLGLPCVETRHQIEKRARPAP